MKYLNNHIARSCQLILPFLLLLVFAASSFAETFTIKIMQGSNPVSGAAIFGNQGVKDLPSRFTNSQGLWVVDTTNLDSSNFTIAFSHIANGLRFEPAEISPTIDSCPGRICNVQAFSDGIPSAVIEWQTISPQGIGQPGLPVIVPGALVPCPKLTDADGYAFFAVKKSPSACNDGDSNPDNNFYKFGHIQPAGKSCTFTTNRPDKFNACPESSTVGGYTYATCSNVNDIAVGSSVNYEVRVSLENGGALSGVKFFGSTALENSTTDGTGKLTFSTSQINVDPNSTISLIPYSTEYQFIPSKLNISPNSCANNICRITAFKNGSGQGVVKWKIKNAFLEPAAGINLSGSDAYLCPNLEPEITNQQGFAYFPSVVRESCNMSDNNIFNDLMSFNAQQTGCTFTHNSQTAFQICPTQNVFDAEMSMHCNTDGPSNFQISGTVYNTDGVPLRDAKIINNSLQVGMTDQNGQYSLTVDRATYAKLEVQYEDLVFDPALTGIDKIASDFDKVNFYAVAPEESFDAGPGDPGACPVKSQYTISGFITDQNGAPLSGVTVYNNYVEKAVSDISGFYSFNATPGESLWVTSELFTEELPDGQEFDPAAYGFLYNYCDQTEVNFMAVDALSHVVSGVVTDSTGEYPIANADVTLIYSSVVRTVKTNSLGEYMHTVPEGYDFEVSAAIDGHYFTPEVYEEFSERSFFNMDFRSDVSLAPTPTVTSTPTLTYTPTVTFTPSLTATATKTYTPSNTATITNTPTNTRTPTITMTPTKTFTPSSTFTNSATPTASRTFTATRTGTITKTPTATLTASATATKTETFTPSATATVTKTYTASNTPTITRTFTATYTASNTPTSTKTRTNTPEPTATKTFTPSKTATPTNTPNLKPYLTSMCSEDPSTQLRWRVFNPAPYSITATWDIYGSNQSGQITVAPVSEAFFYSVRKSGDNTARLFLDGQQVSVKAAGYATCSSETPVATPTHSPGDDDDDDGSICHYPPESKSTEYELNVIISSVADHISHGDHEGDCPSDDDGKEKVFVCHIPPGNPENARTIKLPQSAVPAHLAHGDYLGECGSQTPSPVPTNIKTNTPVSVPTNISTQIPNPPASTATPEPTIPQIEMIGFSGSIKGKNGRPLSSAEKKKLRGVQIVVSASRADGQKANYEMIADDNYDYRDSVPKGKYKVTVANKEVKIISIPRTYISSGDSVMHFAVRLNSSALTLSGKKGAKKTAKTSARMVKR